MTLVDEPAAWRGAGFGLTIEAVEPVPGLGAPPDASGPHPARWSRAGTLDEDRSWLGYAHPIVDYRYPDGRAMMLVEQHPDEGYRVSAPGFGRHIVSASGAEIRSVLPASPGRRWQRLFFAQVLPLAATLQGLDVFHASAVAFEGRAIAFSAPSGTGKTSLAAHLVALGLDFVTDDVLALGTTNGRVTAYPGAGFLGVYEEEVRKLDRAARRRLGPRIGGGEKAYFGTTPISAAAPLAALCFLSRTGGSELVISEEAEPRAQELLGCSFLPYIRSPERLVTHLDVCSRIAQTVRIFRVDVPDEAASAAAALLPHLRRIAAGEG